MSLEQGRENFAKGGAIIGGIAGAITASNAQAPLLGGAIVGAIAGGIAGVVLHIALVIVIVLAIIAVNMFIGYHARQAIGEGARRGIAEIQKQTEGKKSFYTAGVCISNNTRRAITYRFNWENSYGSATSHTLSSNYHQSFWTFYNTAYGDTVAGNICFNDNSGAQQCYTLTPSREWFFAKNKSEIQGRAQCSSFKRYYFGAKSGRAGFDLYAK